MGYNARVTAVLRSLTLAAAVLAAPVQPAVLAALCVCRDVENAANTTADAPTCCTDAAPRGCCEAADAPAALSCCGGEEAGSSCGHGCPVCKCAGDPPPPADPVAPGEPETEVPAPAATATGFALVPADAADVSGRTDPMKTAAGVPLRVSLCVWRN